MSIRLPDSPVRKIHECLKCGTISVKFWEKKHDRSFTQEEWNTVRAQGMEALRKTIRELASNCSAQDFAKLVKCLLMIFKSSPKSSRILL